MEETAEAILEKLHGLEEEVSYYDLFKHFGKEELPRAQRIYIQLKYSAPRAWLLGQLPKLADKVPEVKEPKHWTQAPLPGEGVTALVRKLMSGKNVQ